MAEPFSLAPDDPPRQRRSGSARYAGSDVARARGVERLGVAGQRLGEGLLDWVNLPGRALGTVADDRGPPSREEMVDWGAGTALGMVGMGRFPGAAPEGAVGAGGARLKIPMDDAAREARRLEQGYLRPNELPAAASESPSWYHGSWRADRLTEKGKLDPKRATSGPMPYFTDDPAIASNYAMGKKGDTSLPEGESVANYFTVSPKDLGIGGRADYPVESSWNFLPPEVKRTILDRAPRIGYANRDQASGPFVLHPEGVHGGNSSPDHWNYTLNREARGNPLHALRDLWHDGGDLVNNPSTLSEIFSLAGYPHRISEKSAPWTEARGVMPALLRMNRPLVTSTDDVGRMLPHLEEAFKRDRSRLNTFDAPDMWGKHSRWTPRDWVAQTREDFMKGDNGMTWTSIPDKVTEQLRRLGHDSIIDTGGKMGGPGHRVAIPFSPDQVRSPWARFDPRQAGGGALLGGGAGLAFGSLSPEDIR